MFIVTAKVPRRRPVLLGALAVLALLIAVPVLKSIDGARQESPLRAETDAQRVAYLASLGWEVDAEPVEVLRLTLPETLEEPYRSYNELQLEQGFDLTPYLGKTLERCTYAVTDPPAASGVCQADLYVFEGEIVAGDIVCTGADGFIAPLARPDGNAAPPEEPPREVPASAPADAATSGAN